MAARRKSKKKTEVVQQSAKKPGIKQGDVKQLFDELIHMLREMEQLITALYLVEGLSPKDYAEKLTATPLPFKHFTIRTRANGPLFTNLVPHPPDELRSVIRTGLMRQLPTTIPCVTASRAENELGSLLEQACQVGPLAITRHNAPTALLMAYPDYELSRQARTSSLEDLESEFAGLLASMQTPQSKRAVQKAFEASPAKLGRAAIKHASKKR